MTRLHRIYALAVRLSEADAHRWPLRTYVIEARVIVLTDEGAPS